MIHVLLITIVDGAVVQESSLLEGKKLIIVGNVLLKILAIEQAKIEAQSVITKKFKDSR